jgi:phosphatidylserine decarboxylase
MSIGHHPQQNQHTPDMRKKDADISESERAEAKRRIGGSLTPPREADDDGTGSGVLGLNIPKASMAG